MFSSSDSVCRLKCVIICFHLVFSEWSVQSVHFDFLTIIACGLDSPLLFLFTGSRSRSIVMLEDAVCMLSFRCYCFVVLSLWSCIDRSYPTRFFTVSPVHIHPDIVLKILCLGIRTLPFLGLQNSQLLLLFRYSQVPSSVDFECGVMTTKISRYGNCFRNLIGYRISSMMSRKPCISQMTHKYWFEIQHSSDTSWILCLHCAILRWQ